MITNADCPCLVIAKYNSPPYSVVFMAEYVDDDNYVNSALGNVCHVDHVTKITPYENLVELFPEAFI